MTLREEGFFMEYKISNDLGLITISEDVLLKVAGYAALECYGIVAMSSKRAKDGFVEWLGKENLTKGCLLYTSQGRARKSRSDQPHRAQQGP